MQAELIAKEARTAISRFCLDECPAYCCRKGSISLTPKEVTFLVGTKKADLIKRHILIKTGDKYSYNLTFEKSCPKLVDNRCTVHDDPGRPLMCREFPLFIKGKTIELSSSCFAIKTRILYPFIIQFRDLGYTISE